MEKYVESITRALRDTDFAIGGYKWTTTEGSRYSGTRPGEIQMGEEARDN